MARGGEYPLDESSQVLVVVMALALHAFFLALGVGLFGRSSIKYLFLPQPKHPFFLCLLLWCVNMISSIVGDTPLALNLQSIHFTPINCITSSSSEDEKVEDSSSSSTSSSSLDALEL
jgi:hypothetical protein